MPPAPYHELALSPDGTRLALVGGPGGLADLWVADLGRGTATRLTFDEFVRVPVWTPDGSRIAYAVMTKSANDTRNRVEWRAADGGGDADVLIPEGPTKFPGGFTPDGRALLFDSDPSGRAAAREEAGFRSEIAELSLADRSIRVLTDGPYTKGAGVVSPDGRWLAYVANDGSRETVTVRPYPSGEGRWPVSTVRGVEPRWGPDGRALYFRSDAVLHRVAIDTSRGFSASRPERVLDRVATGASTHSYSIAPDDGRIVTLRTAEGSGAQRILYLDLGFGRRLAGARGGPGGDPPGVDGGRATP
jgi:Tol biopolymer transport system component